MHRKSLWHEKPLATPLLNIDTVCRPETAVASPGTRLVIRREACRVHVTSRSLGVHPCCDTSRSLTHECPVSYRRKGLLHVLTDRQARHRVRSTTDTCTRLDTTSRFARVESDHSSSSRDGDRTYSRSICLQEDGGRSSIGAPVVAAGATNRWYC